MVHAALGLRFFRSGTLLEKDVSPGKAKHPRTRLVSQRRQSPPAAVGALDDTCFLSRQEQPCRVRGGRGEGLAGLSAALPSVPSVVPPRRETRGLVEQSPCWFGSPQEIRAGRAHCRLVLAT